MVAALAFSPKIELNSKGHMWHVKRPIPSIKGRTHPAKHKSSFSCDANSVSQNPWKLLLLLVSLLPSHKLFRRCSICFDSLPSFPAFEFARFVCSTDTSLMPIIMVMSHSRNGSRNQSHGAFPVQSGSDDKSPSPPRSTFRVRMQTPSIAGSLW